MTNFRYAGPRESFCFFFPFAHTALMLFEKGVTPRPLSFFFCRDTFMQSFSRPTTIYYIPGNSCVKLQVQQTAKQRAASIIFLRENSAKISAQIINSATIFNSRYVQSQSRAPNCIHFVLARRLSPDYGERKYDDNYLPSLLSFALLCFTYH